jgi:hypothetical protein
MDAPRERLETPAFSRRSCRAPPSTCATRADLAFDAPLSCTLDGDLFEARRLQLEVTPPATFLRA